MKEEMQKKLFCKIVLVIFFVAECTFKVIESGNLFSQKLHSNGFSPLWILLCLTRVLLKANEASLKWCRIQQSWDTFILRVGMYV